MDLGWGAVIQAVILAACTWYMRQGARADAAEVKRSTASQATGSEILERVKDIEAELALVKRIALKESQERVYRNQPKGNP